jgi:sulfoxide reductase heme-binding subunit YedZ
MLPMSLRNLTPNQMRWVKGSLFVLATLPFVRLFIAAFTDQLGANPVEFITRNTGDWTLYLLCAALAVTPLRKLTGMVWLARLRRMVGLFGFFYAALHFTTFLWFDHAFDLGDMWRDVIKRPFITVGFAAFVLLIPLALTSTNAMVKRIGSQRWQWLHRLVYVILPLGVLHFWWMKAAKHNLAQPMAFAVGVAALLALRLYWKFREKTVSTRAANSLTSPG